jgi:hypothetical protein
MWCYVVFLWNLLARCDRVAQLRWENFTWACDALTVFIPKSKSDQCGDQCGDRAYCKNLFTASNPACCPFIEVNLQPVLNSYAQPTILDTSAQSSFRQGSLDRLLVFKYMRNALGQDSVLMRYFEMFDSDELHWKNGHNLAVHHLG